VPTSAPCRRPALAGLAAIKTKQGSSDIVVEPRSLSSLTPSLKTSPPPGPSRLALNALSSVRPGRGRSRLLQRSQALESGHDHGDGRPDDSHATTSWIWEGTVGRVGSSGFHPMLAATAATRARVDSPEMSSERTHCLTCGCPRRADAPHGPPRPGDGARWVFRWRSEER
jgi:hypothetical protein